MRLIKPRFDILEQVEDTSQLTNSIYKHIEICGRTCYKSEDKITDESAWPFVKRMLKNKHYAMLEHGSVYLYLRIDSSNEFKYFEYPIAKFTAPHNWGDVVNNVASRYRTNKYSKVTGIYGDDFIEFYISTNLRVLVENEWLDDLQFISTFKPGYHERRVTVKFSIDRFTGEEYIRHRVFSFARESTRYCNYSKDKFGNGVEFTYVPWCDTDNAVEPEHATEEDGIILPYNTNFWNAIDWWLWCINACETAYLKLLGFGWQPQQARVVLPCAINSPLIMTGFVSDWEHFFDLRALGKTGEPHPQAKELAKPLMDEFIDRGYIEEQKNVKNILKSNER